MTRPPIRSGHQRAQGAGADGQSTSIVGGDVRVFQDEKEVASLTAGDVFGELGMIDGQPRNARIVASTPGRLAWTMAWDFTTMNQQFPVVADRLAQVAEARSR